MRAQEAVIAVQGGIDAGMERKQACQQTTDDDDGMLSRRLRRTSVTLCRCKARDDHLERLVASGADKKHLVILPAVCHVGNNRYSTYGSCSQELLRAARFEQH